MDFKRMVQYMFMVSLITIPTLIKAQQDSVETTEVKAKKSYKNTLRWNPTANVVFSTTALILGYERVLNQKQSFSINAGYMEFPDLKPDLFDKYLVYTRTENTGFNVAFDYRFYITQRNKFPIPDGFYLGPYILSYNYRLANDVSIIENDVLAGEYSIDTKVNVLSLGFELGYQILVKDRLTFDLLLFGPSSTYYYLNAEMDSDLTIDEENEQLQRFKEALFDQVPWLQPFLEEGEFDSNGKLARFGLGFRYAIMIGYRF